MVEYIKRVKLVLVALVVVFGSCAGSAASGQRVINVKDFGAKGDGKTDDYPAILAAANLASKLGAATVVFPQGVYYLKPYHTKAKPLENIVFRNMRRLTLEGNGSVIKVNGNFHRGVDYVLSGFSYSQTSALTPLLIENSSNVTVRNLELDGGVQNMTRAPGLAELEGHLLHIMQSDNVTLENLKIHHAQTDGIYIQGHSRNLTATDIDSYANARQGMSVIELHNGVFRNCTFRDTGKTGNYGGHSPQAGVDIEPHGTPDSVRNITFENCKFENNIGSQFVVSHPTTTSDVFLKNCTFTENGNFHYAVITNARNVVFDNCLFQFESGSLYPTWQVEGTSTVIKNSLIRSKSYGLVSSTASVVNRVELIGNTFEYTGTQPLGHYFPYIQMKNMVIRDNTFIIPPQYFRVGTPTSLLQKANEVKNNVFKDRNGSVVKPWVSYDLANVIDDGK